MAVRFFGRVELAQSLDFVSLVQGLAEGFAQPVELPQRQNISQSGGREFLVMPVADDRHAGVKLLTIIPGNSECNMPVIQGLYTLFDMNTGEPVAVMDAAELTSRRTAAVSALAADRLSRKEARKLLLVGSGNLVPYFADAMRAVRNIDSIAIWARDRIKAEAAAIRTAARTGNPAVQVCDDLEQAVAQADIVSCLTGATEPIVKGAWLCPGTHLDLVGGYRPDMREADDATFVRASIFVDNREAVLVEAGDILHPLANGAIELSAIKGDISDLASGTGRVDEDEITVFKCVGTAAADLITARVAVRAESISQLA